MRVHPRRLPQHCVVPGCGKPILGHRLCGHHWARTPIQRERTRLWQEKRRAKMTPKEREEDRKKYQPSRNRYSQTTEGKYTINRSHARLAGKTWELSFERFKELSVQPCHYCGEPTVKGLDRVNNKLGYTMDNVVPCCKGCNRMKSTMTVEEWLSKMRTILERSGGI